MTLLTWLVFPQVHLMTRLADSYDGKSALNFFRQLAPSDLVGIPEPLPSRDHGTPIRQTHRQTFRQTLAASSQIARLFAYSIHGP